MASPEKPDKNAESGANNGSAMSRFRELTRKLVQISPEEIADWRKTYKEGGGPAVKRPTSVSPGSSSLTKK